MSGATTELALPTAVDTDDNADYLTIGLANGLRTVDALFNNVTGHSHGGAHQGGPISTVPITAIPDGSITSAKIADGTISTVDLANAAVTSAKLGSDTTRANLLTNGGFEVWQRGNGPFTGNGAYTADRWVMSLSGTDTMTVSKDGNVDIGGVANASAIFTLGSGGGLSSYYQRMELAAVIGRTVTFGIRVYTTTPNAIRAVAVCDGAGGSTVLGALHNGVAGYQTLTVTIAVPVNATFLHVGLRLVASLAFYADNATLVIGSQATDYVPMNPADDLARCLRYYELVGGRLNGAPQFYSYGAAASQASFSMPYHVPKALTPTITKSGTWNASNCSQPAAVGDTDTWVFYTTVAAQGSFSIASTAAGQTFVFEANP